MLRLMDAVRRCSRKGTGQTQKRCSWYNKYYHYISK